MSKKPETPRHEHLRYMTIVLLRFSITGILNTITVHLKFNLVLNVLLK